MNAKCARPWFTVLIAAHALLFAHTGDAVAESFYDCGVLETEPGGTCLLFVARDSRVFTLWDYSSFAAGDTVVVAGPIVSQCYPSCQGTYPCIGTTSQWIQACSRRDLQCGTLLDDEDQCVWFYSPKHGVYQLDSWGGFAVGDSFSVAGWVSPIYNPSWCFWDGWVMVDTISACKVPTPTERFTWGAVRAMFR